ncbi:MAG: hypothetical protein ACFFCP_11615 [Promethearchaeota archaeon]
MSSTLAVLVGAYVLVLLLNLAPPDYPDPFSMFWMLLAGCDALQATFPSILNPSFMLAYIVIWIIIGMIVGPFSKAGWNTVRSAVWVGLIVAITALASELLINPGFWNLEMNPDRNLELFSRFAYSLITSLLALPSALSSAYVINRLQQEAEAPIPSKIETVCECGAVYKSRPLLCSECGRKLSDSNH